MRLRNAAIRYAEQGWAVFECKPGEKVPATAHGCKDATADPDEVAHRWTREYNIGVATGTPSGLYVVDIDGDEGLDAFAELGHGIPATLTAHTPSGGLHLLFTHPGGLGNTASKLAPNVDTRGDGGYIVAAPSVHPNGGRYRWAGKQHPVPLPGWLLRDLRPAPVERPAPKVSTGDADGYVAAAVRAEADAVSGAVEGSRNDTLNRAGWNLGTLVGAGLLGREWAYTVLADAATSCGLPEREIRQTLPRALDDGARQPREVAS